VVNVRVQTDDRGERTARTRTARGRNTRMKIKVYKVATSAALLVAAVEALGAGMKWG
jgi:hypothetical protein